MTSVRSKSHNVCRDRIFEFSYVFSTTWYAKLQIEFYSKQYDYKSKLDLIQFFFSFLVASVKLQVINFNTTR